MKLRALSVNQFRKFTTPTGFADLGDGLNVLVGPNEFGKSTLLWALRAVMFERHGSSAAAIKGLANRVSEAAPVVEASFELDGERYLIRKRFLRKAYAKLQLPSGAILEGERAEETLRDLLSVTRPGNQGAKSDDLGIWSMLWVTQGAAVTASEVPELARNTLRHALESSVGQILGGEQSQRLPDLVTNAQRELLTAAGKPRGRYKDAQEAVLELEQTKDELTARHTELQHNFDALQSAAEALARLRDDDQSAAMRGALAAAEERRAELSEILAKKATEKAEQERLEMHVERLREAQSRRDEVRERARASENRLAQLQQALTAGDEEHARLKLATSAARDGLSRASQAKREADACRHLASLKQQGAQLAAQLKTLEDRTAQARVLLKAHRDAVSALDGNRVTASALQGIEDVALAQETASARLTAAATSIHIFLERGAANALSMAGKSLPEGDTQLQVLDNTRFEIKGVGSIEVSPSIAGAERLQVDLVRAQQQLQDALDEVDASSLTHAREEARRRQALHAEARDLELRLDAVAPANEGGMQSLDASVAQSSHDLMAIKVQLGLDSLPTPAESKRAVIVEEEAAQNAEALLQQARDALDESSAALSLHTEHWEHRRGEAVVHRQESARLRAELESLEDEDSYTAKLRDAQSAVAQQKERVTALEKLAAGDTVPALEARIQRLREALQGMAEKRVELEREQARLQGAVANAQGAGLDEQLAESARALDFAQQELQRHEKEAAVLTLLSETLRAAEQRAHDRFMAPVIEKVQPYLNQLFPEAKLDLDTSMRVNGILRPGEDRQDFDLLSMGTQEQITVLTRIAFAELMAEQGRPSMLVLDDALAYSDDTRLSRLFDVLTQASKNVQMLILTCRESAFAGVGGKQLRLQKLEEGELQSA